RREGLEQAANRLYDNPELSCLQHARSIAQLAKAGVPEETPADIPDVEAVWGAMRDGLEAVTTECVARHPELDDDIVPGVLADAPAEAFKGYESAFRFQWRHLLDADPAT